MGRKSGRHYYPITGYPGADELSFTKIDSSTLEFSARKDQRVTMTGRMLVASNGRSLTIKTERRDKAGSRVLSQLVYSAR
jgi:hypothetical protein